MDIIRLTVKIDRDWDEWVVLVYINNVLDEGACHHTDDRQDAIDTRDHMASWYRDNGDCQVSYAGCK